ncbi:CD209 antigen-like protein C [Aplochiton taeniatus]
MSEDIYSKPDLTKKVKYRRGKMEERVVDIYESVDTLRGPEPEEAPPQFTAGHQRGVSVPPERRSFRAAAVCLGLLCVLLLAGIIGLGLHHVTVIDENIREREQINTKYNNTLTELMKENQYLVKETDELQKNLNTTCCCPSWQKFGSSCYYVSKEYKTWERSRQDCRDRGADLVIINSRQELDFIHKFEKPFWIGLSYSEEEGIWKWVDGTRLPEEHQFWWGGEPNANKIENCVIQEHSTAETSWNDLYCYYSNFWVCERNNTL